MIVLSPMLRRHASSVRSGEWLRKIRAPSHTHEGSMNIEYDDSAPTEPPPDTLSDGYRRRVQRRTLIVVVISQILGGAGLAAGITVGALLAEEMLGTAGSAGLPVGLFTLGSALAAYLVGRITQHRGRRVGLGLGFSAGGLGAAGVIVAAVTGNVVMLFVSFFVYGSGTATNLQTRYAGTDLALPAQRGTAVSVALVSTTFGAVAGPNLVEPLGDLADIIGIPPLAGPFLLAAVAYLAAGLALAILLIPDPYLLARTLDMDDAEHDGPVAEKAGDAGPGAGVYVGATVMVLTQLAMVATMTMTPVHMRAHNHGLAEVGFVIGVHIGAMYFPSPLTGVLVDKIGRIPMAVASAVTLLAAGIMGAAAPGESLWWVTVALALLGLGWNFGLITGTALVVDATTVKQRPKIQGTIDVLIALSGAGGGAMSGVVVAASSFGVLALGTGVLAMVLMPLAFWARRGLASSSRTTVTKG